MADEITITMTLAVDKGNIDESVRISNLRTTMFAATPRKSAFIQAIGFTAHEAVGLHADITASPGFAVIKNHDATNYVELGTDDAGTFVPFLRLDPNDALLVKFAAAGSTIYAKANTASVELEVTSYTR